MRAPRFLWSDTPSDHAISSRKHRSMCIHSAGYCEKRRQLLGYVCPLCACGSGGNVLAISLPKMVHC